MLFFLILGLALVPLVLVLLGLVHLAPLTHPILLVLLGFLVQLVLVISLVLLAPLGHLVRLAFLILVFLSRGANRL